MEEQLIWSFAELGRGFSRTTCFVGKRLYFVGVNSTFSCYKVQLRRKPDNCIVEHFLEVTARNKMDISMQ